MGKGFTLIGGVGVKLGIGIGPKSWTKSVFDL